MGAPSGCNVSVPEILLAGLSGGLMSAVPLARQPAPEGAISKSSWPTVWPSSLMMSLPLSCAKRVELLFCAARVRAAQANIARAAAATVFLDFMERLTPRAHSLSGERFLNKEMRLVSAGSNNAAAENFRDDLGGFAGAVNAIVGELIGRQALGVERAEAGFIAEEW